jgi:hypothetical protein
MSQTRFSFTDVVAHGSVVYYDEDLGLYFAWNGHRTFNVYWEIEGKFVCSDCFLTENEPPTDSWAKQACKDYCQRVIDEMNELDAVDYDEETKGALYV